MAHENGSNDIARISYLIHNLLSHYWVGNEPTQISKGLIQDSLDDLAEFGPKIVSEACARWRIAQNRRPTPADIRLLAVEIQRDVAEDDILPGEKDRAYSNLTTDAERRAWHTDVYAFRQVCLDITERTSPCDPRGKWYDEKLVEAAVRRKTRQPGKSLSQQKSEREERRDREMQLEGRAIVNKWAQARGYADLDAYCAATEEPWVDVYTRIAQEIGTSSPVPSLGKAIGDAAAALGVKAREYTAAEMYEAQVQLGLIRP